MKEQLGYLRNFMKTAVSLSFPTPSSLPPDSVVEASPDLTKVAPIPELFPLLDIDDGTNSNQAAAPVPIPTTIVDTGISVVPGTMDPTDIILSTTVPSMTPPVSIPNTPPLTNSTLLNSIFNSILAPDLDPSVVVKTE